VSAFTKGYLETLAAALAYALAGFALAGCVSRATVGDDGSVTVKYWGLWCNGWSVGAGTLETKQGR